MNDHDLHNALVELAGPPAAADAAARGAIARRVRSARRRIGALSTAVVLVLAVGAAGIAQSAASDSSTNNVVAGRPARCRTQLPPAVPRSRVPAAVRAWAGNRAVVGGGSLWTVRRNLRQVPVREGAIRRLKLGWLVLPAVAGGGVPTLNAERLDGPGRVTGEAGEAFNHQGRWVASTIELVGARTCWQITARLGPDIIRFRRGTGP
jgi:hypothetical protein